jgi:hypothetical protein
MLVCVVPKAGANESLGTLTFSSVRFVDQTPPVVQWPNSAEETLPNERDGLPLARARQAGTRICQDDNKSCMIPKPALARHKWVSLAL